MSRRVRSLAALTLALAAIGGAVAVVRRADVATPTTVGSPSPSVAEPESGTSGLAPPASELAASGPRRGRAAGDGSAPGSRAAEEGVPGTALPAEGEGEGAAHVDEGREPGGDRPAAGRPPQPADGAIVKVLRPPRARIGEHARWSDDEPIYAVAFSADARLVLSAGESRVVFVRDRDTGREVGRLEGHTGGVSGLAVSPDGRRVLTGSYDTTARLWDLATRTTVRELKPGGGTLYKVAFDSEGRRGVTAGGGGEVVLWDLETGAELRRFALPEEGNGAALSADGSRLAAVSSSGLLRLWLVASGALLGEVEAHKVAADEVAFLPGTDELLTSGGDGMLKVWSRDASTLVREWKAHDERISGFALLPDGRTVVTGGWEGRVRAWRVLDGARLWDRPVTTALIIGLSVTADGRTVAVGSRDGMTRLFDAATGEPVLTAPDVLEGHAGAVHALAFVDGRLVSAGQDGTIRVWNVEARAWTRLLRADGVVATSLVAGPFAGRFLAAGAGRIWSAEIATGVETGRIDLGGAGVTALATGGTDGAVFSVVAGQGLRVDAFGESAPRARVADRSGALARSPTQPLVALVGDGVIEFLGLDGTPRTKLHVEGGVGDRLAVWFPDGRSLLVAIGDDVARVDATTGRILVRFHGESRATVAAITPDGGGVVLGYEEGGLVLVDASSGALRRRFEGHKTAVTCVVASPDGRTAISGGAEGAIYVWDLVD